MEETKRKTTRTRTKEQRVPITQAMRRALQHHKDRTGLTPYSFVIKQRKQLGAISYGKITTWLSGRAKTVKLSEYQQVLAAWKELPGREPRVRKSSELLAMLRAERERSNVSIDKLLKKRTDLPVGMTMRQARQFYDGVLRWLPREHFEYLLQCWKALPTMYPVTEEMAETLKAHIERTGKGPQAILRGARERPEELDAAMIQKWLRGGAYVRKDHFDYVMERYAQPDDKILVSVRARQKIQRHVRRTGVNADTLLRKEGLIAPDDPTDWSQWPPSRVSERDLLRIFAAWEALPDRTPLRRRAWPAKRKPNRIHRVTSLTGDLVEVTSEMVATLRNYIECTGKGPIAILRGAKQKPDGLDGTNLRKFLQVGAIASQEHWDYILKLYETPDDRIAVPQRVRDEIRRHVRRTGVGPDELLRSAGVIAADAPGDWSKWPRTLEREDDLSAMLSLWKSLPDRAGPRTAMSSPAPAPRKKGHHKRLQSEELEEHRRFLHFQKRVHTIIPLPEKYIAALFAHLRGNGGQLSQEIRETEFAGLTNEEAAAITRAYMVTLLQADKQ